MKETRKQWKTIVETKLAQQDKENEQKNGNMIRMMEVDQQGGRCIERVLSVSS